MSAFSPIAKITTGSAVDYVFLCRGDMSRNFAANQTIVVTGKRGVEIARKNQGQTTLTVGPGINLNNYFED